MIPKIIHYCWFGGNPLPEKDKKCIESWKKYCPDYEIKEWNESNYNINKNRYMSDAYKEKKWGFVPDYARFDIIYNEGGFYLDTDVELVKSLNELRENKAYMGFEGGMWINGGIGFGAEAKNPTIKGLRDMYENISFYNEDNTINLKPSPYYITEHLEGKGLKRENEIQMLEEMKIYPIEYFAPKDYTTGELSKTVNTISIHQYNASWFDPKIKVFRDKEQMLAKKIGPKLANKFIKVYSFPYKFTKKIKNKGFLYTIKFVIKKLIKK